MQNLLQVNGQKIKLRGWHLEDLEVFKHWQKPGHQWQELDGPYYRSDKDQSEELTEALRHKIVQNDFASPPMRLVIADISNNQLIGTVSSYWESVETYWLCIGITIFEPKNWGQGVGQEALGLWIEFLFKNRPELVRLDMRTWSGNQGLMRLAEKLGFKQEACFRMARVVDGRYFDGLGYGILRSEWEKMRSK